MSAGNKNKKSLKLEHLETEVLRKWAKAYGLKDDKDRKVLLEELVSVKLRDHLLTGKLIKSCTTNF